MWRKDYKQINGIVKRTGHDHFRIDFNKLSALVNGYEEFIEKVKANFEQHEGRFNKIAVFLDETPLSEGAKGEVSTQVFVVFDHHDTYITLLGCNADYEKYPFIFNFSQNKTFVSMMSEVL